MSEITTGEDEMIEVYHIKYEQFRTMIDALGNALINLILMKKSDSATRMIAGILDDDILSPIEMISGWLIECAVDNLARIGFDKKLSEVYADHNERHGLKGEETSLSLESGAVDLARSDIQSAQEMIWEIMGKQEMADRGTTVYKLAVIAMHAATGYIHNVAECDGHHE